MTQQLIQPTVLQPPRSCGDEMERESWAGAVSVRLDNDVHLGIRYNTDEVGAVLRAALGASVVDNVETPPYYSIKVGASSRRRSPMHYLYNGANAVFGARDLARLGQALLHRLSDLSREPDATLRLSAVVVSGPDGAILAPSALHAAVAQTDRGLVGKGFGVSAGTRVVLERDGSITLPEPTFGTFDASAWRSLGPSIEEPTVAAGPIAIRRALVNISEEQAGELRAALGALTLSQSLLPLASDGAQGALEAVVALASSTPVEGVAWSVPDDLVARVADAVSAPSRSSTSA